MNEKTCIAAAALGWKVPSALDRSYSSPANQQSAADHLAANELVPARVSVMNVNDKVAVRLTQYGWKIASAYEAKLREEMDWYLQKQDMRGADDLRNVIRAESFGILRDDGRREYQMYQLMHVFGPHMVMGMTQVFINNEIEVLPK